MRKSEGAHTCFLNPLCFESLCVNVCVCTLNKKRSQDSYSLTDALRKDTLAAESKALVKIERHKAR